MGTIRIGPEKPQRVFQITISMPEETVAKIQALPFLNRRPRIEMLIARHRRRVEAIVVNAISDELRAKEGSDGPAIAGSGKR